MSRRRLTVTSALGALLALTALLSAGGGTVAASRPAPRAQPSGTAAFATAGPPNWIFPMWTPTTYGIQVTQFTLLMYRPIYWVGRHGTTAFNPALSLAEPPVWSNGGRTATITLKRWRWSDGQPITTRDIEFWFRLEAANKTKLGAYHPGWLPDDLSRVTYPSATTFSVTFKQAFSKLWLLDNQLTDIIPLPQHVWDKTSPSGTVGNADRTTKGAQAVFSFLAKQAGDLATVATNPLWKVVDGPFRVESYSAPTSDAILVPNSRYSGPDKPHLAEVKWMVYTSDTAEFDALRAGELTYGYLPYNDVSQAGYLRSHGYKVVSWNWYTLNYAEINYTNPKTGPIMRQLYLRQALQHLVDQRTFIRVALHGYGLPTYGPVPTVNHSSYASSFERHDHFPYSIGTARGLLAGHGWSIHPNGTDTCVRPGSGPTDCGRGIKAGTPLVLRFLYWNAYQYTSQEVEAFKSAASKIGIVINLLGHTIAGVYALGGQCPASACNWELLTFGGNLWNFGGGDAYPTGGQIFGCGSYWGGGYCDKSINRLIQATHTDSSVQALYRYQDATALQVPGLWWPLANYQISVVSDHLHGWTPQDIYASAYPENWTLSR
ncbi:MAG TPA: ABC transporter substrate-binding protein [Candidatus Micrarchaeia archaeon]|nr:ABC transporter substrate-binding protein [Candidatus Micrarchaeia archaeon]